jgi:Zn-dependent protease
VDGRVPTLRDGVEVVDHETWSVAAAPVGGGFVKLSAMEAQWLRRGRLGERPSGWTADEYEELMEALTTGGLLQSAPLDLRTVRVTQQGVELLGARGWFEAVYRRGLRIMFRPGVIIAMAVVGIVGAVALPAQLLGGRPLATETFNPIAAALILLLLEVVATVVHECAHGLVLVHYGRGIRRVGVGFYWGALSFFVDAGEALLLPRRVRVVQSAAGPCADIVLAGAASLAAATVGGPTQSILLLFAVLAWLDVATNLVPLLELDGYWVLADLLNRPNLRSESLQAVKEAYRSGWKQVPMLAAYGIASTVFGLALLGGGLFAWWLLVGDLIRSLISEGPMGWLIGLPIVLPLLAAWTGLLVQSLAVIGSRRSTARP